MLRRNLDGGNLIIEQPIPEVTWDLKLCNSLARVSAQVVGHLQVDVVGRNELLACPPLLQDLRQIVRDIKAPTIVPAIAEPLLEFVGSVAIGDIDIQFALL